MYCPKCIRKIEATPIQLPMVNTQDDDSMGEAGTPENDEAKALESFLKMAENISWLDRSGLLQLVKKSHAKAPDPKDIGDKLKQAEERYTKLAQDQRSLQKRLEASRKKFADHEAAATEEKSKIERISAELATRDTQVREALDALKAMRVRGDADLAAGGNIPTDKKKGEHANEDGGPALPEEEPEEDDPEVLPDVKDQLAQTYASVVKRMREQAGSDVQAVANAESRARKLLKSAVDAAHSSLPSV